MDGFIRYLETRRNGKLLAEKIRKIRKELPGITPVSLSYLLSAYHEALTLTQERIVRDMNADSHFDTLNDSFATWVKTEKENLQQSRRLEDSKQFYDESVQSSTIRNHREDYVKREKRGS